MCRQYRNGVNTRFLRGLALGISLLGVWGSRLEGAVQGLLETPTAGSFQSGIGLIRGWVCSATQITLEADGTITVPAVYHEERLDLQSTCGHSDVGFSFQINWNNLGDGPHTVRALADGVEFGRATFVVATLGQAFLRGAQGEFLLNSFPQSGSQTRIRWEEGPQRFLLSNGGTPSSGGGNLRSDARLEDPAPGSFQSGIGLIRGWVCTANQITLEALEAGGTISVPAVYHEERLDVQGTCGHSDVGFSFQINWNDLGDGPHTVRALADGTEIGRATFTVVTLGLGSFVRGLTGSFTLPDFPQTGIRTQVQWDESLQNFTLTGAHSAEVEAVCTSQSGQAIDSAGVQAALRWDNPCLLSGNTAKLRFQVLAGAALTTPANARAASGPGFLACGKDLSFLQDGRRFGGENVQLLDLAGTEGCRTLLPGDSLDAFVKINAQSELNFNLPFLVEYNQQPVVNFSYPLLAVSPSVLDFDSVQVRQEGVQTFTVTNVGEGTLLGGVSLSTGGPAFVLDLDSTFGLNVNLGAGQSIRFQVRFSPNGAGSFDGSIKVMSNGGSATVGLTGIGVSQRTSG